MVGHRLSLRFSDYLSVFLPEVLPDPQTAIKMLCVRTESTSIIKHVIVPLTITEIIKDLSASPFYGKPQVQVITMQKYFPFNV